MTLSIVILAAGEGKRMHTSIPKVLHPLGGVPMITHVVNTAKTLKPEHLAIVIGHLGESIKTYLANEHAITWIEQSDQLGTGHALQVAFKQLPATDYVLVLYGDVPCVSKKTLETLLTQAKSIKGIALLTDQPIDPTGLGRIVRNTQGEITAIVEEKDATALQKTIGETNTGIMALPYAPLENWLGALQPHNTQKEYYLTDIIPLAVKEGLPIATQLVKPSWHAMGVNTLSQLAQLEQHFQYAQATQLMDEGVRLLDPHRFDLRGELTCGCDVVIDVDCLILGKVQLADQVSIGAYCVLKDVEIEKGVTIKPFSYIEGTHIAKQATVGPFARLRAGTKLAAGVHVGNFVEIKNSILGPKSKANHFGYLGDAVIGEHVNIGAGTVTCNYDGANKFSTAIKDGAFVGSGTMLIAPLTVGKNATIGAGSVLVKDAPADALTLSRAEQITPLHWKKTKNKLSKK